MKLLSLYESSKGAERQLAAIQVESRKASRASNLSCIISLDAQQRFQTFKGFGCAITESAGHVLSQLPQEAQERIVASCFGQDGDANRYAFARTHINSCDFSLENWACVPEKDESLESFSFERTDTYLTPFLKRAAACNGALTVMASPWSPPAWMKTNNDMNNGGKLKPEYRELWARYFVKFIQGLADRGIHVGYVSIQNEAEAAQTWDSCLWTGTEEGEFAARYLKPALRACGRDDIKILVWDHNRDRVAERLKESLSVPGADQAVDGVAYHWYSGDQYENVAECARLFPNKDLFFSEGCVEGGPRPGAWYSGERYGHNIINDLNSGCTAWIDWNLALDLNGGPNHAGNTCDAAILVDTQNKTAHYQSSFYAIGHFSRFIVPGSRRILCTMDPFMTPATVDGRMGTMMESCAFLRPDGNIAFVVTNRTEADMVFELAPASAPDANAKKAYSAKAEGAYDFVCPPRSMQTYLLEL